MLQTLTTQQLVFGFCLFGAVTMAVFMVVSSMLGANKDPLRERLAGGKPPRGQRAPSSEETEAGLRVASISPTMQKITRAVAQPLMPKDRAEASRLRRRFAHAGIYSTTAIHLFVVSKIVLCLLGLGLGLLVAFSPGEPLMGILLGTTCGLIGMIIPTIWLRWKINRRQWALSASAARCVGPDGRLRRGRPHDRCGDSARRTGDRVAHPDISRELGITHMETRVGVSRIDARAQPRAADRQCRTTVAGGDAGAGRAVWNQHRHRAARAWRQPPRKAAARSRRTRCKDNRQAGVSGRVVHLSDGHRSAWRAGIYPLLQQSAVSAALINNSKVQEERDSLMNAIAIRRTCVTLCMGSVMAMALIAGGCSSGPTVASGQDVFEPNDSNRAIWRTTDRQAALSTREEATLYATDFDGNQLSGLGRAHLDEMMQEQPAPAVVYINLNNQDSMTGARRDAVTRYFSETSSNDRARTSSGCRRQLGDRHLRRGRHRPASQDRKSFRQDH